MAVKDSEELKSDERYPLGDYSFRIERTSVPGSANDKVEAICTKDGKNARKSIQIPSSTQLLGWYVEANETEASVYVQTEVSGGLPWPVPVNYGSGSTTWTNSVHVEDTIPGDVVSFHQSADGGRTGSWNVIGSHPFEIVSNPGGTIRVLSEITVLGKPLYVYSSGRNFAPLLQSTYPMVYGTLTNNDFYAALYGPPEPEDLLVGRFAIDLEDAGGDGPGSDWIDPGDYDPDWEEGDPTHTLYVTVTGALSGRHNDPIYNPSYSYLPSDKTTVKQYGSGGDGGNGGGGGAGASTVVVHKFATNQANSKEVTAIAKRHGYGSGGGKGGKGGDGCILVYY